MIVIDTNVIGYLFLTSTQSEWAERVLKKDAEWAAPLLWRSEFRNVLALYMRQGMLNLTESEQIMSQALPILKGREYEIVSAHILRLAATSGCSAYDCEFVALAEDLGTVLVTADKRVLRQFPKVAVSLRDFCS